MILDMRFLVSILLFAMTSTMGCAATPQKVQLAWTFEPRATNGDVRVLPLLGLYDHLDLNRISHLGIDVPWVREEIRRQRMEQLEKVPREVGVALPGSISGQLGSRFTAQFRVGRYPVGMRERLKAALRGKSDLDDALAGVAHSVGGDAILVTWVTSIEGRPLTAEAFPGDFVTTPLGPVRVEHLDEPYYVTADVGMALVAYDGEVVLRYADTYESVMSGQANAVTVARDLAGAMAAEVAKVWACEPVWVLEPGLAAAR